MRQGKSAPLNFTSGYGTAVVYGNTAFFSCDYDIYSFTIPDNNWTKLPLSKFKDFSMVVIDGVLTTIGGWDFSTAESDVILSLSPGQTCWKEVLPPMPNGRTKPATVTTDSHLVVAGGIAFPSRTHIVEVLDTNTLQWSTASDIPLSSYIPWMTLCGGGNIYLRQGNTVHSCSVDVLLKSCKPIATLACSNDSVSVWSRLADTPVEFDTSLVTVREHILAIGGCDGCQHPTADIYCYDVATDSWSVIGQLPTPRFRVLTAVLSSNEVIVLGGHGQHNLSHSVSIGQVK